MRVMKVLQSDESIPDTDDQSCAHAANGHKMIEVDSEETDIKTNDVRLSWIIHFLRPLLEWIITAILSHTSKFIERDESQILKRFIRLPSVFVKDFPLELWYTMKYL